MADESAVAVAESTGRHWREADARAVIEAWQESGQSIARYARSRNIHPERLARWERKLRRPGTESITFHPVRVTRGAQRDDAENAARIEVVLGHERRIRVPHGFVPQDLRAVLAVLEERG